MFAPIAPENRTASSGTRGRWLTAASRKVSSRITLTTDPHRALCDVSKVASDALTWICCCPAHRLTARVSRPGPTGLFPRSTGRSATYPEALTPAEPSDNRASGDSGLVPTGRLSMNSSTRTAPARARWAMVSIPRQIACRPRQAMSGRPRRQQGAHRNAALRGHPSEREDRHLDPTRAGVCSSGLKGALSLATRAAGQHRAR